MINTPKDPKNSIKKLKSNSNKLSSDGSNKIGSGNQSGVSKGDDRQIFIETIAKYCDKCGTPYSINDLRIVKNTDFSSIIHFSCSSCKSNHIATFIKPMGMSSRTPVNTDLSIEEISLYAKRSRVSADEVLDVYNELEEHDTISL